MSMNYRNKNNMLRLTSCLLCLFLSYTTTAQINNPTNALSLQEATRLTLANSAKILQQQYEADRLAAQARIQRGNLDPRLQIELANSSDRVANSPSTPLYERSDYDNRSITLTLDKLYRNGIVTQFYVNIGNSDQRRVVPPPPLPLTNNFTNVTFGIQIPLLKGGWEGSIGADIEAAELESAAAKQDLTHLIANSLLETIQAYWQYRAAVENQIRQQRSEQRIQRWLNQTQGENTARLSGLLSEKRRILATAQAQVDTTRSELALAMGIPANQLDRIGTPTEDFSQDWTAIQTQLDLTTQRSQWIKQALEKRADLKAAQLRLQSAERLLARDTKNLSAEANLTLTAGYNALTLGDGFDTFLQGTHENIRGLDSSLSLAISYPFANQTARGTHEASRLQTEQTRLQNEELSRTISVRINVISGEFRRALEAIINSNQTLELYLNALQGLQNDTSVFTDPVRITQLIDYEDKLMKALNDELTILVQLAQSIARLRFQTGTLIEQQSDIYQVKLNELNRLP